MRELRFRAWDSINNKMWFPASFKPGIGVDIPNEYLNHADSELFIGCKLNGVIFEQYTGLKDKNGVEIYEGDILDSNPDEYPEDSECPYIVIFEDGSFRAKREKAGSKIVMDSAYLKTCNDVIKGNIHENTELLKQSKASQN